MRQNSIGYPGERDAQHPDIAKQAGYTGKNHYAVTYNGKRVKVHAANKTAAIYEAAKHWGIDWTRPEYHQVARADKLPEIPDLRPRVLV